MYSYIHDEHQFGCSLSLIMQICHLMIVYLIIKNEPKSTESDLQARVIKGTKAKAVIKRM